MAACGDVKRDDLRQAAIDAVGEAGNGGFGNPVWVTMVDETGMVCYVATTAEENKDQSKIGNLAWLSGRVGSAQKANTANAFSLDNFAVSSANLYGLAQPGGSYFGVQHSNPVDAVGAYASKGNTNSFGGVNDPLVKKRIGGVSVDGGGLALYVEDGNTPSGKRKIGAIGVAGDAPCTEHAVAWRIRHTLGFDNVPAGYKDPTGKLLSRQGDEMELSNNLTNQPNHADCAGQTPTGAQTVIGVINDL